MAVSVWGPLMEPLDSNYFPWTLNDEPLVRKIVDYFINLLIWFPHSLYLPPGGETVEFLLWQYSLKKLFLTGHGSISHTSAPYKIYVGDFLN